MFAAPAGGVLATGVVAFDDGVVGADELPPGGLAGRGGAARATLDWLEELLLRGNRLGVLPSGLLWRLLLDVLPF